VNEEVIDSKILPGFKNLTFIFAITGETYKLLTGVSFNARCYVQIHDTDYMKQRSVDTMTQINSSYILWLTWFCPIWPHPILTYSELVPCMEVPR